jgi:eukaryotic-like serine/threonine-protein kinase
MAARASGDQGHASWNLEEGDLLVPGRSVVRPLGGGSSYEVFLVWDDRYHALMVAKVLRPDRVEDTGTLRDLRLEAEALDALGHPMIVRGYGPVLDGPRPHLLIEHLEGPSLHDLLRRHGPLALEQVLPLAIHVAGALHFMAGSGYVHLDVKPDNIIMGVPPRLIDLSVARTQRRAERLRGIVGTDAYMAPEQCDPDLMPGRIGPPADIWGLGATLFHALAGSRPFPRPKAARRSDDRETRFPQLLGRRDPLPDWVPGPVTRLVDAMLEHEPDLRPTATEVVEALEPVVAGLPKRLRLAKRGTVYR